MSGSALSGPTISGVMPGPSDPPPLTVAVTGAGGSGAVTAGLILLEAVAAAGLYGLLRRSAGPQIRGGESAALLRFGPAPVHCAGDRCDLLAALDWANHERFADEIPLDADSLVLTDPAAGTPPAVVAASDAAVREVGFAESARERDGGRANMVAVGAAGALAGLPLDALLEGAARTLADKGETVVSAARACIRNGHDLVDPAERLRTPDSAPGPAPGPAPAEVPQRWHINGNEAAGLGALRAGVRFVAAYPITPASEMLEWLAPRLERLGGTLLQAEDELASVNMLIGSAFGGMPALTATSGPGLSLMLEGIGLAVASETPIVVVDVMRGGPSTGIPTKSEQSDLNAALYGLHGDAPHLVLAALDIGDCAHTVAWATRLAWQLQTAAIVLSDQSLGQSRMVGEPAPAPDEPLAALHPPTAAGDTPFRRYAVTADGVSPMSVPGEPGLAYTADGLEHDPTGAPSSRAADHADQLDKRRHKLLAHDYGPRWAEITEPADPDAAALCLLTFGSCRGAVLEAAERLRAGGHAVRTVALRLLAPLQRRALLDAVGDSRVLVVEQNHGAQLLRYLHAEQALPAEACSLARPGPLPLRPGEIAEAAAALIDAHRGGP